MKNKLLIFVVLAMILSSCSDLFSPADQNNRTLDGIYSDPAFAEGLLLNAYVKLPSGYSFNDVATDDAVSNDPTNNYLRMATGNWTSSNNPMDQWSSAYSVIQYLNLFLANTNKVTWATTGQYVSEMFNDRLKGEAYGMRALFMYYLLQAHGGWSADGKLLGVPILLTPQTGTSNFDVPRNTFKECLTQIYTDLDSAEYYLPLDYQNIGSTSQIPARYTGKTSVSDYNRVFGAFNTQRMSARIAKAVSAQLTLLAASPAFNQGTNVSWAAAADSTAAVLDLIGGVSGLAPNGDYWYAEQNAGEIKGIGNGLNPKEILWRTNVGLSNNLESDNYPPSLYGKGRVDPTQNLVDAFPMANGYPITDPNSGYDPTHPYANRDPRLALYVVTNGSAEGPSNTSIYTQVGTGSTSDGLNLISTSTRTGYYMRKLLREDVNLNPTNTNTQIHYYARMRYTEMFLDYAEAANEAWGPDGKGTHSYSARDVIAAIRKRAGIAQPDAYLASITTKDDMRTLIQNERRVELCFEGFRFWDLRRWKANLTEAADGVTISNGTYTINPVENRAYQNYMDYGPIPYSQVLKFGLVQNQGW